MAGLVGYASSDEESEVEQQSPPQARQPSPKPSAATQDTIPDTTPQPPPPQNEPQPTPAQPAPLRSGPVGPSLPPMAAAGPEPQPQSQEQETPLDDGVNAPSSPYSTTRSLLHDLTLPSIPNFDIPPSPPPGSPSASSSGAAAATSKKFEQFLQLKKKGTHFNTKLEQSIALRNPALTDKLLAFVDLAAQGTSGSGSAGKSSPPDARRGAVEQYTTTLPADVWDPGAFPDWAFRNRLRRTRETVAKEREAARSAPGRSAVEFVAASGAAGGASRSSTESPGSGARGEKRKSDWR